MDYSILDFLGLLGAVGLFLYGMKVMSEGLQKAAGDRLRNILSAMTRNRFTGLLTGFFITALIQSSSASTVMVVSFVNAGLMNLAQSMAVIMGANVGTTFTAWIIALFGFKVNISAFIIPLIGFAVVLLFTNKSKPKSIGEFLIGFSFLFMGLDMISTYVPDLQSNPEMFASLQNYASMGIWSVLIFCAVGLVVTAVIQSSAATFAITLIMCSKGWITFELACALVLGSNIGTTITPIIASMSGNVAAKRTAMGHLLFNLLGTVWCLAVFIPFAHFNGWLYEDAPRPYNSYGNGSAMRVSAAAELAEDMEQALHLAKLTAEVTHNHPEGIKGAQATAAAMVLARTGSSKADIRTYVEREFGYDLSRSCDEIRPDYHHVESCQETVPQAITAFLESADFEDALRTAVSLGGDSDTLAAITGSIAETFYGVPENLKAECRRRLTPELEALLLAWEARAA